jgi:cobyric acid synthase
MTLEQAYNEKYVLSDGDILSIHIKNPECTYAEITISTRQYLKKEKYRICKLEIIFTNIKKISLFDNANILGKYSDITIARLDNGNYYVSLDPYENTNEPHEKDNNIIISEQIDFKELQFDDTSFTSDKFTEEDAFWIMWYFLEGHYEISGGEFDVSDILSACQPFEFTENGHFDGDVKGNRRIAPADSGMIWHWKEAIKKYREQGRPKPKSLNK